MSLIYFAVLAQAENESSVGAREAAVSSAFPVMILDLAQSLVYIASTVGIVWTAQSSVECSLSYFIAFYCLILLYLLYYFLAQALPL